jgi:hypothetical protein
MGSIRHFAGEPPKIIRHACGSVALRNRAECQSVLLVLSGVEGASRRDGDAVFQLLLSMAPYSFISLDLSDGPMNLGVPLHHRSAALFELNGSRRNYRNSFITTTPIGCTPNSTASWDRRLLAPRFNGPGAPPSLFHRAIASGSISSSRFVVSLAIEMIWGGPAPITNQINEVHVSSGAAALASQSSTEQGVIPRLLKTTFKRCIV